MIAGRCAIGDRHDSRTSHGRARYCCFYVPGSLVLSTACSNIPFHGSLASYALLLLPSQTLRNMYCYCYVPCTHLFLFASFYVHMHTYIHVSKSVFPSTPFVHQGYLPLLFIKVIEPLCPDFNHNPTTFVLRYRIMLTGALALLVMVSHLLLSSLSQHLIRSFPFSSTVFIHHFLHLLHQS